MVDILAMLQGGDRRSIGRSEEAVAEVLAEPAFFYKLIEGIQSDDPVVRMRAADAAEKVTLLKPKYLQPFKSELFQQIARIKQQEVRWHVAQMIPRVELSHAERLEAMQILSLYLTDKSKIVQTFSLQAMADLAEQDPALRQQVMSTLEEAAKTGSPAVKSRVKKLLEKL